MYGRIYSRQHSCSTLCCSSTCTCLGGSSSSSSRPTCLARYTIYLFCNNSSQSCNREWRIRHAPYLQLVGSIRDSRGFLQLGLQCGATLHLLPQHQWQQWTLLWQRRQWQPTWRCHLKTRTSVSVRLMCMAHSSRCTSHNTIQVGLVATVDQHFCVC